MKSARCTAKRMVVLAAALGVLVLVDRGHAEAPDKTTCNVKPNEQVGVGFGELQEDTLTLEITLHSDGPAIAKSWWEDYSGETLWNPEEITTPSQDHKYTLTGIKPNDGHSVKFRGYFVGSSGGPCEFKASVADLDIDMDTYPRYSGTHRYPVAIDPSITNEEQRKQLSAVEDQNEASVSGGIDLLTSLWHGDEFPEEIDEDFPDYKYMVLNLRPKWGKSTPEEIGKLTFQISGSSGIALYFFGDDGTSYKRITASDSGEDSSLSVPPEGFTNLKIGVLTNDDFDDTVTLTATFEWDDEIKGSNTEDEYTAEDVIRIKPQRVIFDKDECRPCSGFKFFDSGTVYATGRSQVGVNGMTGGGCAQGCGSGPGETLTHSSGATDSVDDGNGPGWMSDNTPRLYWQGLNGIVVAAFNPQNVYFFQFSRDGSGNAVYTELHDTHWTLTHDSTYSLYHLTCPAGCIWTFNDFWDVEKPRALQVEKTGPGGLKTISDFSQGKITDLRTTYSGTVQQAAALGGSLLLQATSEATGTVDSYQYTYYTTGDNEGKVQYVTYRRSLNDNWTNIRRAEYVYYGNDEDYGMPGDLKMVIQQLPNGGGWTSGKVSYYRYYTDDEEDPDNDNGFPHGIRSVLKPEAYKKAAAALGDVTSASYAQLAPYTCHYYEYDEDHRTTKEIVFGDIREYTFSYTDNSQSAGYTDGYNNWMTKAVETRPDGSTVTVYTNFFSQILLKDIAQGANHWISYRQYDSDGHLIKHAYPSAVASYVDNGGANQNQLQVTLHADSGVIRRYQYHTNTSGGAVDGYKAHDFIRWGDSGTEYTLRSYEYATHTVNSGSASQSTVHPLSKLTVYRSDVASDDTEYAYTWHTDTNQILQKTTTYEAVITSRNGSGVSATRVERFDTYGNLIWSKDERGAIDYHEYDVVTGARTYSIRDVDTTQVANEPDGWATPTGFGLHLESDHEHDELGRITETLGPAHNIDGNSVRTASWTVYDDVNDEVRAGGGYYSGGAYVLVNPVSITKTDADGRTTDVISAVRNDTSGKLTLSGTFNYARWTTNSYYKTQLQYTRVYHDIPSSGDGSSGTNYAQTDFAYDAMGQRNYVKTPGGTITRTVFDTRGLPLGVYVGTNDAGATDADPTAGGTNNMAQLVANQYDGGSDGGDGNLTQATRYVDSSTTRVVRHGYTHRNNLRWTLVSEGSGGRQTYTYNYYDNLDRITQTESYHDVDADGVYIDDDNDGDGQNDDILLARDETSYDERGRVWQTTTHEVDPDDGSVGNSLVNKTWYDDAGNVVKSLPAGSSAFSKTVYDGLGRPVKQYLGYDTSESTYAEVDDVDGDTLFSQTETTFDAAGNAIAVVARSRLHDATGTGELSTPSGSQPRARVTYVAQWYDAVGRSVATADYGTADGSTPTRPASAPASSDTVLVSTVAYNNDGEAYRAVDPAGTVAQSTFDDAGRLVQSIQNYVDGTPDTPTPDEDVTVERTYNIDGLLLTLTAKNGATGDQTTQYVYGTATGGFSPVVYRNDLLRAEIYPDSDDPTNLSGNGADGVRDRIEYAYNAAGELIAAKDQNGTVHQYVYDGLGRTTQDRVTLLGTGVDDAVLRIQRTYDVRGLLEHLTSYDDPDVGEGNVVNEVQLAYNDFGLLSTDYQDHDSAVNTGSTPKVQYAYTSGTSNHVRLTGIAYPNARVLHYEYASGNDDKLSRVSYLSHSTSGGTRFAEYTYLGADQVLKTDYTQPDLRLDFTSRSGYLYDRIDRFGRVIDHLWYDYGASAEAVRIRHGYDRASNRTYREDPVAAGQSVDQDEHYAYDGVYQLTDLDRGNLNAAKDGLVGGSKVFAEQWALDPTGNWTTFQQDTDGDSTWDLDQARTHNAANETTQVAGSSDHVTTDTSGNMTRVPKPDDWSDDYQLTYDAWNRLVKVEQDDGAGGTETVARYEYDGRNFRVVKKIYDGGVLAETRHFYYTDDWQCLEERVDTSTDPAVQYVWGIRYVDDLVLRDRDTSSPRDGTLDERLYSLADPNFNVVALAESDGDVVERYTYTAYGQATILTPAFASRATTSYAWHYRYTTRRLDAETGMMYYRNRYYHVTLGRFVTRDPIGYDAGDVNLQRYLGNEPLGLFDPSGLEGPISVAFPTQDWFKENDPKYNHPWYRDNYNDWHFGVSSEQEIYKILGLDPSTATSTWGTVSVYDDDLPYVLVRGKKKCGSEVEYYGAFEGGYNGKPVIGFTFYCNEGDLAYNLTGIDKTKALETLAPYYGLGFGAGLYTELSGGKAAAKGAKSLLDKIVKFVKGKLPKGTGKTLPKIPKITTPYKRPSGATTKAQREAVQGKPCIDCGKAAPKMHADHKKPLVEEYYETGTIDKTRMHQIDAVQPQCPQCSNAQGGRLSNYSKQMKKELGLE